MAIHIGQPHCTERIAITMPAKPIIEPTERSNSPAIISRQAPTAMIANWADTTPQFIAPSAENIPVSDATSRKKTKTRTAPQMDPSSGRTSTLRSGDISLTRSSPPSARCDARLEVVSDISTSARLLQVAVGSCERPRPLPAFRKRGGGRHDPPPPIAAGPAQRYSPAYFSTCPMFALVTKPGPELMCPDGTTPKRAWFARMTTGRYPCR